MGSTRFWLIVIAAQIILLIVLAALGPTTAATPALKYTGWACLVGIFVCVPPLVIQLFIAGQSRIGNGALPLVRTIDQHQTGITIGVWAMIVLALVIALPRILSDIKAEQLAQVQTSGVMSAANPHDSASASTNTVAHSQVVSAANGGALNLTADVVDYTTPVLTPGAGSKARTDILDALRFRLKTKARFRVDHIRTYKQWAFVRATEVVELDKGELQETDLTVAALLELTANSATGGYRIVEFWTLPDDQQHSFADFLRGVRAKQKIERLPAALFPADL